MLNLSKSKYTSFKEVYSNIKKKKKPTRNVYLFIRKWEPDDFSKTEMLIFVVIKQKVTKWNFVTKYE